MFQVNSEHGTAKTSNAEGTRFVTMPQIGVPQVRMGVVGCAMRLVGNHTHFRVIQVHVTVKITLGFASCNFLTVTGTIILELHSNVCDQLLLKLVHC